MPNGRMRRTSVNQDVHSASRRACDRCFRLKEKCRSVTASTDCRSCIRASEQCTTSRERARPGRRPRNRRYSNGNAVHVWEVTAKQSTATITPTCNNHALSLFYESWDGEPFETSPKVILKFASTYGHFSLGITFAPTLRNAAQYAFFCSPLLLREVLLAMQKVMCSSDRLLGSNVLQGSNSVQSLRTFQVVDRESAISILSLGQVLAAWDMLTTCSGARLILNYSITCAMPWYPMLALEPALDPFTCSSIMWDTVMCLMVGELPATRYQPRSTPSVDRLAGLCTSLLPLLNDLAYINKHMRGQSINGSLLPAIGQLETSLQDWEPAVPEDFCMMYAVDEQICLHAQASLYRRAALLFLHRIQHAYTDLDSTARGYARDILRDFTTYSAGLASGKLRHVAFPIFLAATELPDMSSSIWSQIDLFDIAEHCRNKLMEFVTYLWSQRKAGYCGYLHELVRDGPAFVMVP
jgi:hypothetical protein